MAKPSKFRKTLLRVGTHKSPDGEIKVTPERLRHWQGTFERMTGNGQVIPCHWDHSREVENLTPIALSDFKGKKTRSAANSVGRMTDFKVNANGDAAEITFETLTPSAREKFKENAVYVSPVIFPKWGDGGGNEYRDAITHLDFVDHPVDHNQSPAVEMPSQDFVACALRMSNGGPMMDLDEEIEDEVEEEVDEELDQRDDDDETEEDPDASGDMSSVLENLASFNIILPDDTTPQNLPERLNIALATARALENDGSDEMSTDQQQTGAETPTVEQPSVTRMSNEERATRFAERVHRDNLRGQLEGLRDSGRCTPAECDAQLEALGAVRLSLTEQGEPEPTAVDHFITHRQAVPEGTFFDTERRLEQAGSPQAMGHPAAPTVGDGDPELEGEELEATVARIARKR